MKTLKITLIMLGVVAMVSSCKDSDKSAVDNDQVAIETPDYDMDNKADNTVVTEDVVIVDDQYLAFNTVNMKDMYSNLDMTKEQIDRFETDYNKKMQVMRDDTTKTVDHDKLQQEMDQSLKSVLSVEQFKKYDQWKMDHLNN